LLKNTKKPFFLGFFNSLKHLLFWQLLPDLVDCSALYTLYIVVYIFGSRKKSSCIFQPQNERDGRTYPTKIFRRVFWIILADFRFKKGGQYRKGILPSLFESKIGSKEPKNRLKLFSGIGSTYPNKKFQFFYLPLSWILW